MSWFSETEVKKTYGKKRSNSVASNSGLAPPLITGLAKISSKNINVTDEENPFTSSLSDSNVKPHAAASKQDFASVMSSSSGTYAKRKNGENFTQDMKKTRVQLNAVQDTSSTSPENQPPFPQQAPPENRSTAFGARLNNNRSKNINTQERSVKIMAGHEDDVRFLHDKLQSFFDNDYGRPNASFVVKLPVMPDMKGLEVRRRLRAWLEDLGFVEEIYGVDLVHRLPLQVSLPELQRMVAASLRDKCPSAVGVTPSGWAAAEMSARPTPLVIPAPFLSSKVRFPPRLSALKVTDADSPGQSSDHSSPRFFDDKPDATSPFQSIDLATAANAGVGGPDAMGAGAASSMEANFTNARATNQSPFSVLISSMQHQMQLQPAQKLSPRFTHAVTYTAGAASTGGATSTADLTTKVVHASSSGKASDSDSEEDEELQGLAFIGNEEAFCSASGSIDLTSTASQVQSQQSRSRPIPNLGLGSLTQTDAVVAPTGVRFEDASLAVVIGSKSSEDCQISPGQSGQWAISRQRRLSLGGAQGATFMAKESSSSWAVADRGGRRLRRSLSAPAKPVTAAFPSGLETPGCGHSLSQPDKLGDYRTPQSLHIPKKFCGVDEKLDWCLSEAACAVACQRMDGVLAQRFVGITTSHSHSSLDTIGTSPDNSADTLDGQETPIPLRRSVSDPFAVPFVKSKSTDMVFAQQRVGTGAASLSQSCSDGDMKISFSPSLVAMVGDPFSSRAAAVTAAAPSHKAAGSGVIAFARHVFSSAFNLKAGIVQTAHAVGEGTGCVKKSLPTQVTEAKAGVVEERAISSQSWDAIDQRHAMDQEEQPPEQLFPRSIQAAESAQWAASSRRDKKSAATWKRRSVGGLKARGSLWTQTECDAASTLSVSAIDTSSPGESHRDNVVGDSSVPVRRSPGTVGNKSRPTASSSAFVEKSMSSSWRRRRSGDYDEGLDVVPAVSACSTDDYAAEQVLLNELTFKGVVLGGTYQQCFEAGAAVVAPPRKGERRVTRCFVTEDGDLKLRLHSPLKKLGEGVSGMGRWVSLRSGWSCVRSSPNGFLVSQQPLSMTARFSGVCYFLPRHPLEWPRDGAGGHDGYEDESALQDLSSDSAHMHHTHPTHCSSSDLAQPILPLETLEIAPLCDRIVYGSGDRDVSDGRVHVHTRDRGLDKFLGACHEDSEHDLLMNISHAEGAPGFVSQTLFADESSDAVMTQMDITADTDVFTDVVPADDSAEDALESSSAPNWSNSLVVLCVLEFLFAGNFADLTTYHAVNKAWALGSYRLFARHGRYGDRDRAFDWVCWDKFVSRFSWGAFLSRGACKQVYCVQNATQARLEAVSVMDVEDLKAREMDFSIAREIEISMMCSALVHLNICPNLILVHSLFRSEYPAPETLWNGKMPPPAVIPAPSSSYTSSSSLGIPGGSALNTRRPAQKKRMDKLRGDYQFIRMEFCRGGDMEDLVRKMRYPDVDSVRSMLFQMCYAMFCCRDQLSLRHFDIKLLNFFVTNGASILPAGSSLPVSSTIAARFGLGDSIFELTLRAHELNFVKIADFGTSFIGGEDLGSCITEEQFTTLENTPPEFLLLGSAARQAFSADTFCLGLSFLHLITGEEPYEELLRDVRCPEYLRESLKPYWETRVEGSPFRVIGKVIECLDACSSPEPGLVFYDTLYRYLVLFGVPEDAQPDAQGASWRDSPVWHAALCALGMRPEAKSKQRSRRLNANVAKASTLRLECIGQFNADHAVWCIRDGSHDVMKRTRQRLSALSSQSVRVGANSLEAGGDVAMQLLLSMTSFDPSRRCTMIEALRSSVFAPLRVHVHNQSSPSSGPHISFMHYYTPGSSEAEDDLAMI